MVAVFFFAWQLITFISLFIVIIKHKKPLIISG